MFSFSGKGLSIWDIFASNSSHILDGSTGEKACNSYNLFQTDIGMLKSLNVKSSFAFIWDFSLINKLCASGFTLPLFHLVAQGVAKGNGTN